MGWPVGVTTVCVCVCVVLCIYPAIDLSAWCRFIFIDTHSLKCVFWDWGRLILDLKFFSRCRGEHSAGVGNRDEELGETFCGWRVALC